MQQPSIPAAKTQSGRPALSVLDLVPISEGMSRQQALNEAVNLARTADQSGYARLWMAEHHGSLAFMCSASPILLARNLDATTRIRLGAGGVMLPNHMPFHVAEEFGTLATLYPGRVDLGLGRAPGTDPATARALGRRSSEPSSIRYDIKELVNYLGDPERVIHSGTVSGAEASIMGIQIISTDRPNARVRAIPGEGTEVPLWMLSSSIEGAKIAASLGLPYSFASHFSPHNIDEALAIYREEFNPQAPTAQCDHPVIMMGVSVIAAPTSQEAHYLATSSQRAQAAITTGHPAILQQPTKNLEESVGSQRLTQRVRSHGGLSAIGSPAEVEDALAQIADTYAPDELITITHIFDPALRRRSLELVAHAWGM